MKRLRHPPSVARRLGATADPEAATGGLIDGLRRMAEGLQAFAENAATAQQGERSIDIGGKEGRMVFGYTIRTAEGLSRAEPFGHVPPPRTQAKTAAEPPPRQPIVDILEEPDCLVVLAEMPGVGAADLSARIEDGDLVLESTGARRWHKRIALPGPVDAAAITLAARNGIVEVRLPRAGDGA